MITSPLATGSNNPAKPRPGGERRRRSAVLFLADPVLLEFFVEVGTRCADGRRRGRDVPLALAQLLDEEGALGRLLEVAQRRGALDRGRALARRGAPEHFGEVL